MAPPFALYPADVGDVLGSGVGGAVLMVIVGLIKSVMAKSLRAFCLGRVAGVIEELGAGSGEVVYLRDAAVALDFPSASGANPADKLAVLVLGNEIVEFHALFTGSCFARLSTSPASPSEPQRCACRYRVGARTNLPGVNQ